MHLFLTLAFLFFVGSVSGWVLELFFRRFFSASNPERKWINPGFCTGPYLPLYGSGLCILYLIATMEDNYIISDPVMNKIVLFAVMAISMTAIEYIAGICSLKFFKLRLWDYRGMWGNIQGIICPFFSLAWAALGAIYYFFIHPYILEALDWLSKNLAFSFVIGLFFGVFIIDVVHSAQLVAKLKKFADDNNVVVRYETIKSHIRSVQDKAEAKTYFFSPFFSDQPMSVYLKELKETFEDLKPKRKKV